VKAATLNKDHGLLEHWLRNVRDVVRKYRRELAVSARESCLAAASVKEVLTAFPRSRDVLRAAN
jgi:hypothetical protein